ncbi:hypothetical protein, conserved [Eimeria brunetti]|uniref:non-specific serine/threonine protein kinase n=1 Tax=Eimeria brunetti TaxID=51314 RepID=U6LK17_9EIME|nr:hypothetical protein, conserved [Eimeria brunetti]
MFGRWKLANSFTKTTADTTPPAAAFSSVDISQHNETTATSEKTYLRKAYYFCMIQTTPHPSTFVFTEPGDYIISCNCTNNVTGILVPVPLGPYPEYRGTCGYLLIKVRDKNISLRQSPPVAASPFQGNNCGAYHFFKETGKGLEVFTHVDAAENFRFCMIPKTGINTNGRTLGKDDSLFSSFSFRRILLGSDRPSPLRRCLSNPLGETAGNFLPDESCAGLFTEYELSVSRRFEVFLDTRLGKGGNGEVFLAIDRKHGVPVAIKREPKEMLRHEFSLICEIRLSGSLLTYKAQDPHPSKFLGLIAHSVALEVGNSAVAAAVAHHSAAGDSHDHLALELVNGGELRKLLKTKFPTGMPLEMARAYIYQITCSLVLIHAKSVIHRDLKTQNILVRSGDTFENDELKEAARQIPAFQQEDVTDRLPFLQPDAREFLLNCLTKDPQRRPTAFQLLTGPFLFPLHIFQVRRRVETTDVYNSYMHAFERGWGNIRPIEELAMAERLSYDNSAKVFISEFPDPDAVNVVLPIFECMPDFQPQNYEMRLGNWVLASNGTFYIAPGADPKNSIECQVEAPTHSVPKTSPVSSVASSGGSSQDMGESISSPSFVKLLPDTQSIYQHANGLMNCGLGVPQRGSTCSTSIGSPPQGPPIFGGADKQAASDEAFETLVNRIDSL